MAHTELWWDIRTDCWHPWKHHKHHHKSRPTAPRLTGITIKEKPMPSIVGVTLSTVDIVVTLPTTRVDGTDLANSEIQSVTILRDPGTGVGTLTTLNGPFNGATALFSDVSPATGSDVYSFFVTDTAGTQGVTSPSVTVTIEGQTPLAQPAAGTLTAIARAADVSGSTPAPGVTSGSTPDVSRPTGFATTGPAAGAPTSSTQVTSDQGVNTTVLPKTPVPDAVANPPVPPAN
jgi:hypothetical protein